MRKNILLSFLVIFIWSVPATAQTSRYSIGIFGDIMLEAPTYSTYYGLNGRVDLSNHSAVQAFVGYSNVHMTTVGADYIYNIKNRKESNFNIYGGIGLSGDFYRQKIEVDFQGTEGHGYAKANYFAFNPTIGLSYYANPVNSTVFMGYKAKYYPFEDAIDINFLSLGIRYHL